MPELVLLVKTHHSIMHALVVKEKESEKGGWKRFEDISHSSKAGTLVLNWCLFNDVQSQFQNKNGEIIPWVLRQLWVSCQ